MNEILATTGDMLWSGWIGLLDYLAAHVLLCLIPAFVIAGYLSAMIPKEIVTRYLGPRASGWVSYPAAALGGFVLAVCSCTILPLFAGIWKRGAGLGAAITFLFVGPAVNILAIAYTGAAIGMDIALARILLSLVFGIGIGLIMAWVFRAEELRRQEEMEADGLFDARALVNPAVWTVLGLLLATLIVGTLQIELLTGAWISLRLPLELPRSLTQGLSRVNLTPHGALLILMLVVSAPVARLGLDQVLLRVNRWTYAAIGLCVAMVLVAAPKVEAGSLQVGLTGRFFGLALIALAIGAVATRAFTADELAGWLWETWKFIKQIFPLLIVGVFAAGMLRAVIPEAWIQAAAGRNTVGANAAGVLFGVFMYFPTLVEVPIARMFLDLGMHRGPLLAYLLADPELSLQSILVTGRILGRRKTALYVVLVAVFSTLAGYLFGGFLSLL